MKENRRLNPRWRLSDRSMERLLQFREFLSCKPELVGNKQQTDEFIELANKVGISFWSGDYIQELIASPDLGKAFEDLNRRWKQARRNSKI